MSFRVVVLLAVLGAGAAVRAPGASLPRAPLVESGAAAFSAPRLVSVTIHDQGTTESADYVVDTTQDVCPETDPPQPERYFDSSITFGVTNPSNTTIRLTGYSYKLEGRRGKRSTRLSMTGAFEIESGETGEVRSLFTDVTRGHKRVPGARGLLKDRLGIKNVSFTLYGVDGFGKSIQLSGAVAVAFRNVDRCGV